MSTKGMATNPLGTQPIRSLIWKFAIPGIITQLVSAIHNIVDQVFLGWGVGDLGVAATNIVFPVMTIITALSALIGSGAAARFSILLGKKQADEAADTLGNAISLMTLFGILLLMVTSIFLEPMLYLFGATDLIMPFAQPYARIICVGIPFGIFSIAGSYFIHPACTTLPAQKADIGFSLCQKLKSQVFLDADYFFAGNRSIYNPCFEYDFSNCIDERLKELWGLIYLRKRNCHSRVWCCRQNINGLFVKHYRDRIGMPAHIRIQFGKQAVWQGKRNIFDCAPLWDYNCSSCISGFTVVSKANYQYFQFR